MTPEQVVALCRQTIEAAFWVAAPILISAMAIGLVINVGQVLTSIQDTTVSTVPRLTAVGILIFFLAPWILHHLLVYTRSLFSDFRLYAR
jgi:flagellar biosynthetic protein FliQ